MAELVRPVRQSVLKHIATSPAHYRYAVDNNLRDTRSMRIGRALHSWILGTPNDIVIYEGGRRDERVAKYREWKAEQSPDAIIMIPSELSTVQRMREAIETHKPQHGPSAIELLRSGAREQEIRGELCGRAAAGRPDCAGDIILSELKTDVSSDPRSFMWRFYKRYHYDFQLAFYHDLLRGLGRPPREVWSVVVESAPGPSPVTCFRIPASGIESGRRKYCAWLETLRNCEENDYWPAYADGPVDLEPPQDEVELTIGGQSFSVGSDDEAADVELAPTELAEAYQGAF